MPFQELAPRSLCSMPAHRVLTEMNATGFIRATGSVASITSATIGAIGIQEADGNDVGCLGRVYAA